jgi:hypothetical protein
MTQEELINQIKEARKEFLDKDPCKHCSCDNCRICEDVHLRYELTSKIFKLKEEFKKLYNLDYDDYVNNQKLQSQYSLNKELLIRDLSARLPYNVALNCKDEDCNFTCYLTPAIFTDIQSNNPHYEYKPYLLPLSSMTKEQQQEECQIKQSYDYDEDSFVLFDWYNKNHFDYRGLISKGLALNAIGLNIY